MNVERRSAGVEAISESNMVGLRPSIRKVSVLHRRSERMLTAVQMASTDNCS